MTGLEAINEIEDGITAEIERHRVGTSLDFWKDSTISGLSIAAEIVEAIKNKYLHEKHGTGGLRDGTHERN